MPFTGVGLSGVTLSINRVCPYYVCLKKIKLADPLIFLSTTGKLSLFFKTVSDPMISFVPITATL
ncbi:MAG: hypothetical protein ACI8PW_001303 [Methylophilaceae bacterium]|jgi:hypothetical protein